MHLTPLSLFLSLLPLITVTFALQSISSLKSGVTPILSRRQIISKRDDVNPSTLYPAYNLSVPIDHFHNESAYEPHSTGTFNLRYFFDATYYKPGGPVIVLASGEASATDRLPFLQKGIAHQLAEATGGIAVVLEHRYYGTSFPTPDLSTENLRFLTTQQALADTDFFARNVVFEGFEDQKLTAPDTAYIAYGGSYAGAFVAFLRKTYPDTYYGAISSSGVTEAIYDFWEYFEPIREYGPPDCVLATQKLINIVDNILLGKNSTEELITELKTAFGLQDMQHNDDFANALGIRIEAWQNRNWDPSVNDPSFSQYCSNITAKDTLHPTPDNLTSTVKQLIEAGGYASQSATLTTQMLNYIGYVNTTLVQPCIKYGLTTNQCFTTHNTAFYARDDLAQTWRSWPYQYCTQWGYLQTSSSVPATQLPLISRTITLAYESHICVDAFNITTPPNTAAINAYGGYNISYPRLAFIDGEQDPWRGATPHAVGAAKDRTDTLDEPFVLIGGGVHHWDENGLFANETAGDGLPPASVKETQGYEVVFVRAWMEEWKARGRLSIYEEGFEREFVMEL